ncbi:DUF4325 domain-containing protein [bacterium]|nr:DUF4325 domain-containing protein [bacterium]
MSTKEKILKVLKEKKQISGGELSSILEISRQALNKHLKELIQNDKVIKEGVTRGATYKIFSSSAKKQSEQIFKKSYLLKGLEEHKIFEEVALQLNFNRNLRENVLNIFSYVFTEILNNAIEHSKSEKCNIEITLDQYSCIFSIRDYGIGIFYSIFKKFNLPDEYAAVGELIKGKITTMKEKHAGEGVFFTSKAGDTVSFRSHKTELFFCNVIKDTHVSDIKYIKGTEAIFKISRYSKKQLKEIFERFAPEEFDYKFEKTKVFVRLFQKDYMSRSEAKRLLSGLDKFKEIILDFKGVNSMGQGFADEIFRVFQKEHPIITIKTENLSPILEPMIKHVVAPVRDLKNR